MRWLCLPQPRSACRACGRQAAQLMVPSRWWYSTGVTLTFLPPPVQGALRAEAQGVHHLADRGNTELDLELTLDELRDGAQRPQGFRWVVPGMLAGTPQPGVVAPVDHDLTLLRHGLKNTHLPIFDRKAPSASQMHMLLVRTQRLMEAGEVLAVHCKAGLGRTGLALATWLVRDGGWEPKPPWSGCAKSTRATSRATNSWRFCTTTKPISCVG